MYDLLWIRERLFIPGYPISEKGKGGGVGDLSAQSTRKMTKSLREGGLGYGGGGGGSGDAVVFHDSCGTLKHTFSETPWLSAAGNSRRNKLKRFHQIPLSVLN